MYITNIIKFLCLQMASYMGDGGFWGEIEAQKEREDREFMNIKKSMRTNRGSTQSAEHIGMVGDNTARKWPLQFFQPNYIARHASYKPTVSEFWESGNINFVINNQEFFKNPDIIVLLFGGNDIAFIKTEDYNRPPPTNREIIRAMQDLTQQIHAKGILVVIVPIHYRKRTNFNVVRGPIEEFKQRALEINKELYMTMPHFLPYNPT